MNFGIDKYELIRILIVFIIFTSTISILLLSFTIYYRFRYIIRESIRKKIRNFRYEWIASYLSAEDEHVKNIKKRILRLNFTEKEREFLLYEILDLKNTFTGREINLLEELYLDLKLYDISYKKIKSFWWNKKAQGLRELALMNRYEDIKTITSYLNHKNKKLSNSAYLSLFHLEKFDVLDKIPLNGTSEFSDWSQLIALSVLKKTPRADIELKYNLTDKLNRLYQSKRKEIILFTIRIRRLFHFESDIKSKIDELLKFPDVKIQLAEIDFLDKVEDPESLDVLINNYKYQSISGKLLMAKTFSKIGNLDTILFLENQIAIEKNQSVIEACTNTMATLINTYNIKY